jgi:hypothetical protein
MPGGRVYWRTKVSPEINFRIRFLMVENQAEEQFD